VAVVLGTLLLCGVAVVGLHGLALTRATRPLRLESLRAVSDSLARDPESVGRLPSRALHAALLDERGQRLRGDPLPLWLPAAAPRSPDGEHCASLGAPCWAVRRTRYAGSPATVVAYYSLDPELVSPLSVALVGSLGLGVLASAGAGFVLLGALRAADEQRRRLLAGLAHDLGTPLTSIRGFAETALGGGAGNDRRGWTIVYREALRMQRQVEDMLALARLEAGRLAVVPRPFDLAELVQAAVERAALAHGSAPELAGTAQPLLLHADRDRIDQVLGNLLDNAYRHGRGQGVRVALERGAGSARVEVTDAGPGLSARAREHLFEAFHRDGGGGGSGLGLSIAHEIAHRHGGTLRLEDAPGGGCRAVLELPLHANLAG
jgi:signal transduction histidine kinase